jgi:hypothetical protein
VSVRAAEEALVESRTDRLELLELRRLLEHLQPLEVLYLLEHPEFQ